MFVVYVCFATTTTARYNQQFAASGELELLDGVLVKICGAAAGWWSRFGAGAELLHTLRSNKNAFVGLLT